MSLKARHPHFRAREAGLGLVSVGAGNGECEDGNEVYGSEDCNS